MLFISYTIGETINNYIIDDVFYDKYGHKLYKLRCSSCNKIINKRKPLEKIKQCTCQYDLTNKNIGFLHINYMSSDNVHRDKRRWNCTCICGKNIDFCEQAILKEHDAPKSCGCINISNYLVGKKFDKLIVVKYCGKKNKQLLWECRCECNRIVYKTSSQLINNKRLGCDECIHNVVYTLKDDYYECCIIGTDIVFYIDKEDYEKVVRYNWSCSDNGYIKSSHIYLHRLIMNVSSKSEVVDHINHNKFYNRKRNLRIVSHSQNSMNSINQTNNLVGVRKSGKSTWRANIYIDNECKHLGTFTNINDAILTRKNAEEKYFGEYSYKNSMKEGGKDKTFKNLFSGGNVEMQNF